MSEQQRRYLIALAAEATVNPAIAGSISAAGWRAMMFAIDEDMGRPHPPDLVVDQYLADIGVRWEP